MNDTVYNIVKRCGLGKDQIKVSKSVLEHSKITGLDPTKTLCRAWWFYLAFYEKLNRKEKIK